MYEVHKDHGVIRVLMAGALVLFVAACSGSGDGVKADRDMYKEQAEELTRQLESVKSEIEMVTGERDTVQSEVESLNADVARLTTEISALTSARDGYQARLEALQNSGRGEDLEEIADLTTQIETLDSRIEGLELELEGDGTDANPGLRQRLADLHMELDGENPGLRQKLMELQAERDQLAAEKETYDALEEEARRAEEEAERQAEQERLAQERIDAANTLWATLTARRPGINFIFSHGDNWDSSDDVSIARDADGTVTVSVPGYNTGTNTADPTGNGWTPVTLTKDGGEVAVVVTDIAAPESRLFNSVYGTDARENVLGDTPGGGAQRRSVAEAAEFPDRSLTRQYGDDTGNPGRFSGTLDGVAGEYECKDPATGCSVTRNPDGTLAAVDGWRFTPDSNVATVLVPSRANGHWGWWYKPGDVTSDHLYSVPPASGGIDWLNNNNARRGLTGSATYSGAAAGLYVTSSYSGGVLVDADSGSFVGDAQISVNWRGSAQSGLLQGEITDILFGPDMEPAPWSVRLKSQETDWGTFGYTALDNGGGVLADNAGRWYHVLFGGSDTPAQIRGGFHAFTNFLRLSGAYGTKLDEN